jgi:CBS domain-containing protein
VQMRNSLSGIPVTRAMLTDFKTLSPQDTLAQVVGLILSGSQHDFPVLDANGSVIGILERDTFINALSQRGQSVPVVDVIRRDLPSVDSHEMVEKALMRLQEVGAKTLPVVHGGQFVGLITTENITEFLMIRSALKMAGVTSNPVV